MLDAPLHHEEESLDLFGPVFAVGTAFGPDGAAGAEGAEAGVGEEFGAGLLGDGDAGDELGGGGAGDGGGLLEDGEAEDFVEEGFVDRGPGRGVEGGDQVAVRAHVADVFDGAEVDAAGCEAVGLAVGGEGVKEDVGGGVVGLAFLADEAGYAGEEGEEVEEEMVLLGYVVEVPGSLHFGFDGLVVLFDGHGGVGAVLEDVSGYEWMDCLAATYSENHGALYDSAYGNSCFLERTSHIF